MVWIEKITKSDFRQNLTFSFFNNKKAITLWVGFFVLFFGNNVLAVTTVFDVQDMDYVCGINVADPTECIGSTQLYIWNEYINQDLKYYWQSDNVPDTASDVNVFNDGDDCIVGSFNTNSLIYLFSDEIATSTLAPFVNLFENATCSGVATGTQSSLLNSTTTEYTVDTHTIRTHYQSSGGGIEGVLSYQIEIGDFDCGDCIIYALAISDDDLSYINTEQELYNLIDFGYQTATGTLSFAIPVDQGFGDDFNEWVLQYSNFYSSDSNVDIGDEISVFIDYGTDSGIYNYTDSASSTVATSGIVSILKQRSLRPPYSWETWYAQARYIADTGIIGQFVSNEVTFFIRSTSSVTSIFGQEFTATASILDLPSGCAGLDGVPIAGSFCHMVVYLFYPSLDVTELGMPIYNDFFTKMPFNYISEFRLIIDEMNASSTATSTYSMPFLTDVGLDATIEIDFASSSQDLIIIDSLNIVRTFFRYVIYFIGLLWVVHRIRTVVI